jgi:hypothetical protein
MFKFEPLKQFDTLHTMDFVLFTYFIVGYFNLWTINFNFVMECCGGCGILLKWFCLDLVIYAYMKFGMLF